MPRGVSPDTFAPTDAAMERAYQVATMVQLRLERFEFAAAHAAIVRYQEEYEMAQVGSDPAKIHLCETGLDLRNVHTLEAIGVNTLGQLAEIFPAGVLGLVGIGPKSIDRMAQVLQAAGLYQVPAVLP